MKLEHNFESAAPGNTRFRNVGRDFGSILAQITCNLTENPNSSKEVDQIKYKGKMTNNLDPKFFNSNQR